MASWADTTFSTTSTIANHEGEVNTLTSSDWSAKITLAKTIMGNDIQEILVNTGMHYWTDFDADEILLDIVTNKSIFNGLILIYLGNLYLNIAYDYGK